jgi:hypothetical protein
VSRLVRLVPCGSDRGFQLGERRNARRLGTRAVARLVRLVPCSGDRCFQLGERGNACRLSRSLV